MSSTVTVDAITVEIVRNAFVAAAEEMNATLIRSAYTPIIYEGKDCSVALLDADHRILGQSAGLPIFLGNLEICVGLTEERYGREVWKPGDVWMVNDSYLTGTHLNDMTVYAPIFFEDELAGFSASRAHWLDIGAKDPGGPMDSTEIYQEGLRIPPLKVVAAGEVRADITEIIALNTRFPYPTLGDLHAQIAVARTGERRLQAILERYGRETVESVRDQIFEQAERLDREAVAAIPDGTYRAEGCLDNDGVTDDPCWIRVEVVVAGDAMTIDLSGCDDAARGSINCGEAQAVSACRVAFQAVDQSRQADQRRHVSAPRGHGSTGLGARGRGARRLSVVLQPPRSSDRPRRCGDGAGHAGPRRRGELRRLDDHAPDRHRRARSTVRTRRGRGRRLGRLGGERR